MDNMLYDEHRYPYGCKDTAARAAVEGAGLCGKAGATKVNAVASIATALGTLPKYGFVYMGSPYSLYRDGFDEAARLAEQAAAHLMGMGLAVYSPIAHGHAVAQHGLPTSWNFWKRQCDPFIDAASALVVLKLDGWRDSVGLTYEIARFHEAGKPIVYMTMEELANGLYAKRHS